MSVVQMKKPRLKEVGLPHFLFSHLFVYVAQVNLELPEMLLPQPLCWTAGTQTMFG